MIGITTCLYALITPQTPLAMIVALGFALGFWNSLQFTRMNSIAYADIEARESSMAATIASSFQQISMSFGLALASLVTGWFLDAAWQSSRQAVIDALHHAYLSLGAVTVLSSLTFRRVRDADGASLSHADSGLA